MNVTLEEFKRGLDRERERRRRLKVDAESSIINNLMRRRYKYIRKCRYRKGRKRNVRY